LKKKDLAEQNLQNTSNLQVFENLATPQKARPNSQENRKVGNVGPHHNVVG